MHEHRGKESEIAWRSAGYSNEPVLANAQTMTLPTAADLHGAHGHLGAKCRPPDPARAGMPFKAPERGTHACRHKRNPQPTIPWMGLAPPPRRPDRRRAQRAVASSDSQTLLSGQMRAPTGSLASGTAPAVREMILAPTAMSPTKSRCRTRCIPEKIQRLNLLFLQQAPARIVASDKAAHVKDSVRWGPP